MAALVAVLRRNGDVSRDQFESLLETLADYGHDGCDRWYGDGVALGHQHHWTTPQAVGQRQPIELGGSWLVFAGRLDNRDELVDALAHRATPSNPSDEVSSNPSDEVSSNPSDKVSSNPSDKVSSNPSDAELFGRAYEAWGSACLERLIGPFAVALWDRRRRRLLLARDKTGLRSLFVATTPDGLVAASDVRTLRTHPAVSDAADEIGLAAFLRNEPAHDEASIYRDVRRFPPGTRLVVDPDIDSTHLRFERYWHPSDGPDLRGASRAELRRRLRSAVRKAIDARLRTRTEPAVMMSGGVDSTTVASVAAADLGRQLPAFSMVFEAVADRELTDHERGRLRDTAERHTLALEEVLVDDAWPLTDPDAHDAMAVESPVLDPLHESTNRLHRRFREAGHEVVLTGEGGNKFDGSRLAYADLLRRGRLVELLQTVRRDPMPSGWLLRWYGLAPTFPSLAARFTDGGDGPPPWIGPRLHDIDVPPHEAAEAFRSCHRRRRYRALAGLRQDIAFYTTRQRARRAGLELRTPLLDARVVELAYAIPPHALSSAGEPKVLFRSTFGDLLPESVRSVSAGRHFGTFVNEGLRTERDHLASWLSDTRLERRGYLADGAPADLLESFLETGDQWALVWRLYGCERWFDAVACERRA